MTPKFKPKHHYQVRFDCFYSDLSVEQQKKLAKLAFRKQIEISTIEIYTTKRVYLLEPIRGMEGPEYWRAVLTVRGERLRYFWNLTEKRWQKS